MRRSILPLIALVLALASAAGAGAKGRPTVVGIVGGAQLAHFDARTLRPLAGRLAVDGHESGWSFSANGRRLVLGQENESCVGGSTSLRLVDVPGLRALGDVPLAQNGGVVATFWIDASHVLAVVTLSDCIRSTGTVAVLAVDPKAMRVTASTTLRGDVVAVVPRRGGLVVLLAPHERLGTARLAVVDAEGKVRVASLGEIRAGRHLGSQNHPTIDVSSPGLAVDSAGGRAFVVPAGNRLAEIDLGSLRVVYRDLSERRSAFARFRRWLDPPAEAKGSNGPTREAVWLGDGLLAVTGADTSAALSTGGGRMSIVAAGLRLVDTRDWTFRTLNDDVSSIRLVGSSIRPAGSLLLAFGSSYRDDGATREETNAGLVAYSLDGHERYRLFEGKSVQPVVFAGRGYATVWSGGGEGRTFAFDPATGKLGKPVSTRTVWSLLR